VLSLRRVFRVVALITFAGGGGYFVLNLQPAVPEATMIPDVVRETELHIAPEINGHLAALFVRLGQQVRKGDLLAQLSNPELTASVIESKAALGKARADRDNVFAGVREEVVKISAEDIAIAESKLVLVKRQYQRSAALAADAFASKQMLDERTATLRGAEANLTSHRELYKQNKAGPTKEERQTAQANVVLAEAAVANLEAKLAKTKLVAPAGGEAARRRGGEAARLRRLPPNQGK
jgi:HlyD family secretion protein